jgi:hypothetical protein
VDTEIKISSIIFFIVLQFNFYFQDGLLLKKVASEKFFTGHATNVRRISSIGCKSNLANSKVQGNCTGIWKN